MDPNSKPKGRPEKPVAKRPAVKPVAKAPQVPAAKPVAAKPVAARPAPVVAKPKAAVAKQPAPQKPVAAPVAAETEAVVVKRGSSNAWTAAVAAAVVIFGGAGWWWANREKAVEAPATVAATPAPVFKPEAKPVATPLPPLVIAKPAAPVVPAPVPAPMPEVKPAPTPAPAPVVASVDPYAALLSLDAVAARSPAVSQRAAALLRAALQNHEVGKYADLLQRSMAAEVKRSVDFDTVQRYDRFFENPFFMRAFFQHELLSRADEGTRKLAAESSLLASHLVKVCENNAAMETYLETATVRDNFRNVMQTWAGLASDDTEALGTYRDLAIACSLVFEKPHQFKWNGHDTTISAADRYQWYKKHDKAGQLETKLTNLSAWELSWVVGAPVPQSEMEWTLTELRRKLKQGTWGQAYDMVPYDMQKAVTGKMKDPYEYYTFAEILKKGGICGDRAYFSANTARCMGIPAVAISGDGPQGPHAWIAWLSADDKWSFSGRMGGYPAGRVGDPRNGESISENVFTRLSDTHLASRTRALKSKRLVWFSELHALLKQDENAQKAVQYAISNTPYEPDLWLRKIDLMAKAKPEREALEWKSFLDSLRRRFSDDPDMLAKARKAEDTHVLPRLSADAAKNELRGDIRHLDDLKGLTSTEEILAAHRRYAELFAKSKDVAGIRRIYREALDDYGREPAKFKALANDYWKFVKDTGDESRKAACRDIERSYERHVETKATGFFDVQSQASAAKVVSACWREAGDAARADRIDKETEKRVEKATKNAL